MSTHSKKNIVYNLQTRETTGKFDSKNIPIDNTYIRALERKTLSKLKNVNDELLTFNVKDDLLTIELNAEPYYKHFVFIDLETDTYIDTELNDNKFFIISIKNILNINPRVKQSVRSQFNNDFKLNLYVNRSGDTLYYFKSFKLKEMNTTGIEKYISEFMTKYNITVKQSGGFIRTNRKLRLLKQY